MFLLALLLGLALADHVSFLLALVFYFVVFIVLLDRATEPFAASRKKWRAAGWFCYGGVYLFISALVGFVGFLHGIFGHHVAVILK